MSTNLKIQNPLLRAALAYGLIGWKVVPLHNPTKGGCSCKSGPRCGSIGKHPRIGDWVNQASSDETQITDWWQRWPEANVGIACGPDSNVFLFDVDGDEGREELEKCELPETPISTTGKGFHIVFSHPYGLEINTKNAVRIMPGCDIRTAGGQFVAPPSLHASGKAYTWSVSPFDIEPAPVPDWLIEKIKTSSQHPKPEIALPQGLPKLTNGNHKGKEKYLSAVLQTQCDRIKNAPQGKRHTVAWESAKVIGGYIAGEGLDAYDAERLLLEAAMSFPDADPREREKVIRDGLEKGKATPITIPPLEPIKFKREAAPDKKAEINESTGEIAEDTEKDNRPELSAQEGDLKVITALAWAVLEADNNPPRLFKYANRPQRFESDGERWLLHDLEESILRFEVARAAKWFKIDRQGHKVNAVPPRHVIQDMLAMPDMPLPELVRVVETPVFSKEGQLIQETGYHNSGIYFYPTKGLLIPKVNDCPSSEELENAKAWITELLYDFPFADPKEKSNAIAVFVEPFSREMVSGPTPLRLIEASTPGSGKGLLSDVLTRHATKQPGLITQCQNEEEWNKSLITQLRSNVPVILIDNISTSLDSGALAAALTSEYYGGRLLGTNETAQYPNRALWLATANNPTMTTEIARRTVRIRLDPKQDRPWQREGFRHKDLRQWALDNRANLIWSALTLIQHWISEGKPEYKGKPLGSFESWSKVIGGILQSAGIEGFLSNLDEFYETADSEGTVLRNFVSQWWAKFGADKVSVGELFSLTTEFDGFELGRGGERSQRITFGKLLGRQRDRVIGGYAIQSAGISAGTLMWRLKKTSQENLF